MIRGFPHTIWFEMINGNTAGVWVGPCQLSSEVGSGAVAQRASAAPDAAAEAVAPVAVGAALGGVEPHAEARMAVTDRAKTKGRRRIASKGTGTGRDPPSPR